MSHEIETVSNDCFHRLGNTLYQDHPEIHPIGRQARMNGDFLLYRYRVLQFCAMERFTLSVLALNGDNSPGFSLRATTKPGAG